MERRGDFAVDGGVRRGDVAIGFERRDRRVVLRDVQDAKVGVDQSSHTGTTGRDRSGTCAGLA